MKQFLHKISWPFVAIVCITIVAFVLRYSQIWASDVWYDEAFTGITVRSSWSDMIKIIINDKVHPPLYYLLLKVWTLLLNSTTIGALRGFSVLWGVLLIPLTYIGVQKGSIVGQQQKALFGIGVALFFAINPFFIAYSVEARSYSLFTLLFSLFVYFCVERFAAHKTQYMTPVIICCLLLSLTHFIGLLSFLSVVVLVLLEKKILSKGVIAITTLLTLSSYWLFVGSILKLLVPVYNFPGWVPAVLPKDLVEFWSAILLGVDRQARGVPPVNALLFGVPSFYIGMMVFVLFCVLLYVLCRKWVTQHEERLRYVQILAATSVIPIFGVVLVSRINVHLFVERYLIGFAFAILLFLLWLVIQWSSRSFVSLIAIYIALTFLVIPPRQLTKYQQLTSLLTDSETVYFRDPGAFVIMKYYLEKKKTRLIVAVKDSTLDSFSVIRPNEMVASDELTTGSIVVLSTSDDSPGDHSADTIGKTSDFTVSRQR